MSIVYSIACQKGGVGKTSTAISVAAGLARRTKRILLIDLDPQANSSKVLLHRYQSIDKEQTVYPTILERRPLSVHQTTLPNLDIVPGHIMLSDTDMRLTVVLDHREERLKSRLDKVRDRYDFVIIDCPPNLNWLTINAFTASDFVIVPLEPGYFELDSTIQIGKVMNEVKQFFNPDLAMKGFLFNKSDGTISTRESLNLLREAYPDHVLKTIIPRNVDLKNASMSKQDIFTYNPNSKSAQAFEDLIEEVFL
jgi:chromosome partitioning protein